MSTDQIPLPSSVIAASKSPPTDTLFAFGAHTRKVTPPAWTVAPIARPVPCADSALPKSARAEQPRATAIHQRPAMRDMETLPFGRSSSERDARYATRDHTRSTARKSARNGDSETTVQASESADFGPPRLVLGRLSTNACERSGKLAR